MAVRLLRDVFDLLIPPICSACGERLKPADDTICRRCRDSFVRVGTSGVCHVCGKPTRRATKRRCPACPPAPVHFDRARSAFRYRGAFPELFHTFKYNGHYELGPPLARAMFMALREFLESEKDAPDLLIPVPLHYARRLQRGFNQSEILAREIGRLSGLPVCPDAIVRRRYTTRQALLAPEKRALNLLGAFEVDRPDLVRERCVGLVDDVLTTGHTVNECARMLREAGAREIFVITMARA